LYDYGILLIFGRAPNYGELLSSIGKMMSDKTYNTISNYGIYAAVITGLLGIITLLLA
jgi:hypothetical protein